MSETIVVPGTTPDDYSALDGAGKQSKMNQLAIEEQHRHAPGVVDYEEALGRVLSRHPELEREEPPAAKVTAAESAEVTAELHAKVKARRFKHPAESYEESLEAVLAYDADLEKRYLAAQ